MPPSNAPVLGILNLYRGDPPGTAPLNRVLSPEVMQVPVLVEPVPDAWADRVIDGDMGLTDAYVAAAQRLVVQGATVITANCGFAIRYQAAVAAAVRVPVGLSSLLLLPVLLRQLPAQAKIALLTADAAKLTPDLFGVDEAAHARIVVGGIEGGRLWTNERMHPPPLTPVADIEADVSDCVTRLMAQHPDIAVVLSECTGFPLVTPAIRRITGRPVYDIRTLCRMNLASVA